MKNMRKTVSVIDTAINVVLIVFGVFYLASAAKGLLPVALASACIVFGTVGATRTLVKRKRA